MDTILQFGRGLLGLAFCLFLVMYGCAIFLTRKKSALAPEDRVAVQQKLHVAAIVIVMMVVATALMSFVGRA